jgi:protein phosphatase
LANGKLTVIDATNVQKEARAPLVHLARENYVQPVALVLDVPESVCLERNSTRPDRQFGPHVVRNHTRQMRQSLRNLEKEGFRFVHVLRLNDLETLEIARKPLWNNKKEERGPFDIIGDVHGCADELEELLQLLGYQRFVDEAFRHPEGRQAVFVGDIADRGPRVADAFKIVMKMERAGTAWCVSGNHDEKLKRYLSGKTVKIAHGLQETLDDLNRAGDKFKAELKVWLDERIAHYVFDEGRLVVAHAGLKEAMHGARRALCVRFAYTAKHRRNR